MKKFIAFAVMLCAVIVSSTATAATMANWVFVKDCKVRIPYVPKYTEDPADVYQRMFDKYILQGKNSRIANFLAERYAREYKRKYDAEQLKLQEPDIYKLWSYYIDTNSVAADQTADGSVAFHVVVKDVCTDVGREMLAAYFRENKKPVPAGLEKLSFIVKMVHFKSPDGITKYYAIRGLVAFTTDGAQIQDFALSNAPLN